MTRLIAASLVLLGTLCIAAWAAQLGPNSTDGNAGIGPGSSVPLGPTLTVNSAPPSLVVPLVAVNTCNITTPVSTGSPVNLVGGGTCAYTATCNAAPCTGGNAISSWTITTQSDPNAFAIDLVGNLSGGSNAADVTVGVAYTVTVKATNPTGDSIPVVEPINVPPTPAAPVVTAQTCDITVPVSNGSPVALQGGGNCTFTALCAGIACTAGNAITGWAVVAQSCTNCFALDSSGDVLGGTGAGSVTDGFSYSMTVTATNAIGTSPNQVQFMNTPTVNGLLLEAGLPNLLLLEDGVSHLCLESGC